MRKIEAGGAAFIDLKVQITGLLSAGNFDLVVRSGGPLNGATITMGRDQFSDTLPCPGSFGLPEYRGGEICPNVHTVRMTESDVKSFIAGLKESKSAVLMLAGRKSGIQEGMVNR